MPIPIMTRARAHRAIISVIKAQFGTIIHRDKISDEDLQLRIESVNEFVSRFCHEVQVFPVLHVSMRITSMGNRVITID